MVDLHSSDGSAVDSSSSVSDADDRGDVVHPENPACDDSDPEVTISGLGWRRKQVRMVSVANAKPSPVRLRNGFVVLFYQLDNSVRASVQSSRRKSKTVSNAGLALKATRDWPTEFAFLEDPGFLKALGDRRIRLVDIKDYFMSWFHRSVPRVPPLVTGTSAAVEDEITCLGSTSCPPLPPVPEPGWFDRSEVALRPVVPRPLASDALVSDGRRSSSAAVASGSSGVPGVASSAGVSLAGGRGAPRPSEDPSLPTPAVSSSGVSSSVPSPSGVPASSVAGPVSASDQLMGEMRAKIDRLEALIADKDSEEVSGSTPEDKEVVARLVTAWKKVKPYFVSHHPEFLRSVPGRFIPLKRREHMPKASVDRSELSWSRDVAEVFEFLRSLVQGTRDIKGNPVKGGKRLVSGSFLPHMLSPSLRKFYRTIIPDPPLGTSALDHLSETAKSHLESKSISISRTMFRVCWESSKVALEISNYLTYLGTALRAYDGGKWFDSLDETQTAMFDSMQIAISDLHGATAMPFANFTLRRRDEVVERLGVRLSLDSKQSLREASFDLEEVLDSVLFDKAVERSRKLEKDKAVLPSASGKGSAAGSGPSGRGSGRSRKSRKNRGGAAAGKGRGKALASPAETTAPSFRGAYRGRNFRGGKSRGASTTPAAKTE